MYWSTCRKRAEWQRFRRSVLNQPRRIAPADFRVECRTLLDPNFISTRGILIIVWWENMRIRRVPGKIDAVGNLQSVTLKSRNDRVKCVIKPSSFEMHYPFWLYVAGFRERIVFIYLFFLTHTVSSARSVFTRVPRSYLRCVWFRTFLREIFCTHPRVRNETFTRVRCSYARVERWRHGVVSKTVNFFFV